ncbi:hypothetical protein GHT06_007204 [Daphnia sinensis]|uniref:Uncharacterized protein n=1 Tax=Daphnia sinensis TaxID=1820382 RepID=A0AAD5PN98_9CRUS|nr:hypothetical protein GHT06_006660 [Daphnia sinensis]KAI9549330.1 hypothetical protein GHT06_006629 [Daphnia sinensis]KAI9549404.1 hypothetical protein GHT06_007204 [Daphnia sinensis]
MGVHEVRIGRAFVVHAQHGAARVLLGIAANGVDVINVHAIVVIANAARPVVRLKAAIGIGRQGRIERIACSVQHAVLVAGRQDHVVEQAFFHRGKAKALGAAGAPVVMLAQPGSMARPQTQTTAQQTPTCGILQGLAQDILKVGVVRGVANRVKIVVRHVKLQGKRAIGGLSRDILMAKI